MPTISGKLQSSNTSTWVSAIIAKVLSWGDIAWLLIAFYISAVVIAVTLQLVMKVLPFPFFWSSLQFFASYWLIIIYQRISKLERKPLVKSTGLLMIAVLSNVLGFIFMNVSVGYVKAPFIETVRGMECVSTMILGSIFLSERHSLRCLFTLLPICGGVFLSCQQGSTFDLTGLILLAASNILFSARSVVLRMLQNINPLQVDPYNFYADISYLGLVLLIPITMIVEGTELYDVIMVWLWGDGAYHMHSEELHITTYKQYMDTSYITIGCFLFLVLASTISFAISNCTSLILLHKTDLLSHSVAVVFRRVFTIFVAAFFLGINLNRTNQAGVALSLSGIILYSYFKFAE